MMAYLALRDIDGIARIRGYNTIEGVNAVHELRVSSTR